MKSVNLRSKPDSNSNIDRNSTIPIPFPSTLEVKKGDPRYSNKKEGMVSFGSSAPAGGDGRGGAGRYVCI